MEQISSVLRKSGKLLNGDIYLLIREIKYPLTDFDTKHKSIPSAIDTI